MKTLVLAEKPSVATEYAKVLGCSKKSKGYYEGKSYVITWALGHLVTLAEPGDYDQRYREWQIKDLPLLPEKMKLKVIGNTSHQFKIIRNLVHRKDVNEFIIATDAGREGELVARWILILSGWRGPFKRLWISSQTDRAIREGFLSLKNGSEYNNLFKAAAGRAEADWLIGLNVTRALTCKFDAQLSAGRVQTPTLSMIIKREEEIKNFKPLDYWTIKGAFHGFNAQWRNNKGNSRLFDFSEAQAILDKVKNQPGIIIDLLREEKKEFPPLAYNLTELQREGNKIYGYSAKKTLSILQNLYEHHKLVSYPRTDSRYITEDMVSTLNERLKAMADSPYGKIVQPLLNVNLKPGKGFVNNNKVSDHHAIIPTEQALKLTGLTSDEKRIYDLIARRFITVLYPPSVYDQVIISTIVAGEKFHTVLKEEKNKGWRAVSPARESSGEDLILSNSIKNLRKGAKQTGLNFSIAKSRTMPPARFTEASLLTAMEFPQKYIENKELQKSIKDGGLGTPATRAEIIEKLVSTDYIYRKGMELVPTPKGFQLFDLVPDDLKSPQLTALWELRLANIAGGRDKKEFFIKDISAKAVEMINTIKADTREYKAYNLTSTKCAVCAKYMLLVNDKRGKILKCSDRKCGYTQPEYEKDNFSFKKNRREKQFNKRLIDKFSDHKKSAGLSVGSLFEDALKKKK